MRLKEKSFLSLVKKESIMILKLPTKRSLLEVISFENLFINNLYQNTSLPMTSEIKQDYPLNLSISVSGGKENNNDYLSSGE